MRKKPIKRLTKNKATFQESKRIRETRVRKSSLDLFSSAMVPPWQIVVSLGIVVSIYLMLCYCLDYGLIDDAYISLRYARNLAEGKGLVFNLGERVEGYTNFLWTLLLTIGFFLKLDGVGLSIGLGIVGGCILLILVFFMTRHHLAPNTTIYRSITAPLCVVIQLPFLCYSLSGLETTFFTLLLMGSIYFVFMGMKKASWFNYASLTLSIASLTRPEANIIFFFNLIFLFWYRRKNKQHISLFQLISYAAIYICIVGSFFLWRYIYYGFWLPNTYYAKIGGGVNMSIIESGIGYVWSFSLMTYLIGMLPLVLLIRSFRKEVKFIYFISFTCTYFLAVIYEGGDHLAMFRFCIPVIPVVAILYQELWVYVIEDRLLKRYPSFSRFQGVSLFMVFVFITGLSSSLLISRASSRHGLTEYERSKLEVKLTKQWAAFGRWLKKNTKGDEKIALITAGAIPFYSELYAIDMVGLTDTHIAHMSIELGKGYAGHEKFDNEYVLSQRPRFILANHQVQFERYLSEKTYNKIAYFSAHRELVKMPALHRDYRYRCVKVGSNQFYSFYQLHS